MRFIKILLDKAILMVYKEAMKQFHWEKIREFREAAGLTQHELGLRLGLHPQQISAWENNPNEKSLTTFNLGRIAEVLGKNTDDFFMEA